MRKLLLTVALSLAAVGVQAVPLSTLAGGGSITAGDKVFSSWKYTLVTTVPGKAFNADNIEVTALNDGGMNPGPGLRFTDNAAELTVSGNAYIDLTIEFRATASTPGLKIKDNSLELTGSSLVYTADGNNNLGVYITERVGTAPGLDDLGDEKVESSVLNDFSTQTFFDSAAFAPQTEIWVSKNILVRAADASDAASLISFDQRFSQTQIPEPASIGLVALAFAGLAATRRRKQ